LSPSSVIAGAFDEIATRRRVFKVETIGGKSGFSTLSGSDVNVHLKLTTSSSFDFNQIAT